MTEKAEFFYQAMRFTPILGVLDLLLILHFCTSWYRSAKKTGWKVDIWYLTLFLGAFQSILLLYPFNASIYNYKFTHGLIDNIMPFVDQAFLISVLGYICIWAGRFTYDFTKGKFPLIAIFQCAQPFHRMIEKNIKSKKAFLFLILGTVFLGLIILGIQFGHGEFFNGRRFFLSSPKFRPLFNATISIIPIAFCFASYRFVQYKEKSGIAILFILSLLSLFSGVRSIFVGGMVWLFLLKAFYQEGRVSLKKIAFIFFLFFFIAVTLTNIREGNYDVKQAFVSFFINFFYGNNFSDTRDFAWILSCWDEEYLYGKSYLAGLISFIPRSWSSFRETWSISMYTNSLTGFSSDIMPGLRPGLFGESYLNFGLFGVALFGWVFGFALRYADVKIKMFISASKDLIKGYSHGLVFSLISCLAVTAAVWGFYIFILINLAMVLFREKTPLYCKT